MKYKAIAAALALAAAAVSVSLAQAQAPSQAPLKIGFLGVLSGPQGPVGQDQYDGFMLHVEANGCQNGFQLNPICPVSLFPLPLRKNGCVMQMSL